MEGALHASAHILTHSSFRSHPLALPVTLQRIGLRSAVLQRSGLLHEAWARYHSAAPPGGGLIERDADVAQHNMDSAKHKTRSTEC